MHGPSVDLLRKLPLSDTKHDFYEPPHDITHRRTSIGIRSPAQQLMFSLLRALKSRPELVIRGAEPPAFRSVRMTCDPYSASD